MPRIALLVIGVAGMGLVVAAQNPPPQNAAPDFTKQPSVLAKTPEEQLKTFILQPGYRLELVLADPII